MVNNWNPWGQPGNGAPNVDTRIRNLEMDGLYPVNKSVLKTVFYRFTMNIFVFFIVPTKEHILIDKLVAPRLHESSTRFREHRKVNITALQWLEFLVDRVPPLEMSQEGFFFLSEKIRQSRSVNQRGIMSRKIWDIEQRLRNRTLTSRNSIKWLQIRSG